MSSINPGEVLVQKYRIVRQLGAGAFGRTYLAHDLRLDAPVVVKELLEKWSETKAVCLRFVNEAQAMRRAQHPNVVIIHDLLTPDDVPSLRQYYIVMEFMEGGSLEGRMRAGLTWEEGVRIAIGVCSGLGRAHALGIVHRDIKPANVLLSRDLATVKISDFGVAHLPDRHMTAGTMHPGTLLYMAPESFCRDSAQIDGRVDLYALGVTLYQVVTGKEYLDFETCWLRAEKEIRRRFRLAPNVEPTFQQQIEWQALTQRYWMDAVCTVMPPDPREHNPQVPPDLAAVIMTSLAKQPDQRYPTAEAMAEALRKAQLGPARDQSTNVTPELNWQLNDIIARSLDAARQDKLGTALELIQHAINLAPENPRALATLANIQMMRSDFSAACQAWEKVLALDPSYPEAYAKLGQCFNRMEQYGKAIAIQTQGLRRPENRDNASLLHGLANSYHLAGRLDEAIWALERSLQLRPDRRLAVVLSRWRLQKGARPDAKP